MRNNGFANPRAGDALAAVIERLDAFSHHDNA
jgi:hypothetical protein